MPEFIKYSQEQLREFASKLVIAYNKSLMSFLPFDQWESEAFPILFEQAHVQYPKEIRVAPSTREMLDVIAAHSDELDAVNKLPTAQREGAKLKILKEILQPAKIFTLNEPITDDRTGVPIWFGDTSKGLKALIGFKDGNKKQPYGIDFDDMFVHGKMSGGTGSGKSVTMHTLVTNLMLYNAPWELQLYLADFKLVELTKYAEPVPAPHVAALIGSENTVLAASVFEAYAQEMKDRQSLFKITGVSALKDFRKRFNMIMPRCIILVDEFAQLFTQIKKAMELGSATADSEKSDINRALGELARLGRSMGCHMLLSSQSLTGLLEDQTDKQFKGGIALKVNSADDSVSVIGNDAAAYIEGKGKCFVNLDKAARKVEQNIMVQVPYIDCELSDEDMLSGRQTYVTETVSMLKTKSDALDVTRTMFYSNDDVLEPISTFHEDIEKAYQRFRNSPYLGTDELSEINRNTYKSSTAMVLTAGRSTRYCEDPVSYIDLQRKANNNILVSGGNTQYLINMLVENMVYFSNKGVRIQHAVVPADKTLYQLCRLEQKLSLLSKGNTIVISDKLPFKVFSRIYAREYAYSLSETLRQVNSQQDFDINGKLGIFNTKAAFTYVYETYPSIFGRHAISLGDFLSYVPFFENVLLSGATTIKDAEIKDFAKDSLGIEKLEQEIVEQVKGGMSKIAAGFFTLKNITGLKRYLVMNDFPILFIWLIGLEAFAEVIDRNGDLLSEAQKCLKLGSKYNIFTIMTASKWTGTTRLAETANFIIENEKSKEFFSEVGLKNSINIYEKTLQIHDRGMGTKQVIKEFKL